MCAVFKNMVENCKKFILFYSNQHKLWLAKTYSKSMPMDADIAELRGKIMSAFKLHGFTLKSESSKYLVETLSQIRSDADREDRLNKIICSVHKQPLESTSISKNVLETAVKECGQSGSSDEGQVFSVLNAFQIPKYEYDTGRKKFMERSTLNLPDLQLFGTPEDKANVFVERYFVIYQRLLRHELFAPLTLDVAQQGNSRRYQLLTVEALLACSTKIENVVTFGMLAQLKEDKFFLEDPTGVVQLDLSEADFQTGLYTENCLCLVEGVFEDSLLMASAIGFAPIETSINTLSHHFSSTTVESQSLSLFQAKQSSKLLVAEREHEDAALVFLSDVWLDSAMVLEKLRHLFNGFAEAPPVAMVFAGDFLSKYYGANGAKVLKDSFKNLADLVQHYPNVAQRTHFVFVPSLRDPFLTDILPKPPLPTSIVHPFSSRVSHCHLATNPCHLRYYTQDIVVFREDIVEKMCRNCVRAPSIDESGKSVEHHFAKTILSQSHLTPLPLHVSPVYWAYDYTLRLYPLPDLIVCCDKYKPFTEAMSECIVTNPGSFARNSYSFQVYSPARKQVEDSEVGG